MEHELDLESLINRKESQFNEHELSLLLEEYKLIVNTSENLLVRRQTVNTAFLSLNALLLSAVGILVKEAIDAPLLLMGVIAVCIAGILLCIAWFILVRSYRQLNTGKFVIIHLLEQYLPASIFKAEWKALGEGQDKNKYTPFTKTETRIPIVFAILYGISIICGLAFLIYSF